MNANPPVELDSALDSSDLRFLISLVHGYVYECICSRVYADDKNDQIQQSSNIIVTEEDLETLFRFGGTSLSMMIKKRKETIVGNRGHRTEASNLNITKELSLLEKMVDYKKLDLPTSLRALDEGNLTFPKSVMLPFFQKSDLAVREFINDTNVQRYPNKFLDMAYSSVFNSEELETLFADCVNELSVENASEDTKSAVFKELLKKLTHIRTKEFLVAKKERGLKELGKIVDADQNLRDGLRSYAVKLKRKLITGIQ